MEKKRIAITWPTGGRVDRYAFQNQPPFTTPAGTVNVWPNSDGRQRGGSRPALVRAFSGGDVPWQSSAIGGTALGIGEVSLVPSTSSRIVTYVVFLTSDDLWLAQGDPEGEITSGPLLTLSPSYTVQTSEWNQKLYIAGHDINQSSSDTVYLPQIYDPVGSTVEPWEAEEGTIPKGCRCIATFRDRLVLAGGTTTPHGVFFARQGDPLDWDFSADDEGGAVSLSLATAGGPADTVRALAPHADNCMIVGGQKSLWMLIGDPRGGGQLANLSTAIGIVDHYAYCTTPDGWFVFLSADGLYAIPAGCGNPIPQSLSREKLPRELIGLGDMTETGVSVSLAYDIFHRGIHIVVAGVSYWFFDWETKSFWKVSATDEAGENGIEPNLCRSVYTPHSISNVLFTCSNPDTGVRRYNEAYTVDDEVTAATARRFASSCVFGPFGDATLANNTLWERLEVILADSTAGVEVEVFRGDTAEEAAEAAEGGVPAWSRSIGGGRSQTLYPRVAGTSLYLKISSDNAWAFEAAAGVLGKVGRVRV